MQNMILEKSGRGEEGERNEGGQPREITYRVPKPLRNKAFLRKKEGRL